MEKGKILAYHTYDKDGCSVTFYKRGEKIIARYADVAYTAEMLEEDEYLDVLERLKDVSEYSADEWDEAEQAEIEWLEENDAWGDDMEGVKMKKSEVIEEYRDNIAAAMREDYRSVLECGGRIEYQIYVWEDGEIEELQEVQGSHTWLKPKDGEERQLFHVITISYPFFNPWDFSTESIPDDDDERENAEKEIIDWLCDEYENDIDNLIDEQIRMASMGEDD